MNPVKFAILGAGRIARKMADTARQMPETVVPCAVAARELARARAFAEEFGFAKAYGSYEELAADPEVELVYIATPNHVHADQTLLCLRAGKHVLCEKPFAANARQAREMLGLAREKNLLLAEAIWPRYMPMAQTIRRLCEGGEIGHVYSLTANLGYELTGRERLQEPSLAGGALLDLGIYALTFASIAFGGEVADVSTTAVLTEKGVDAQNSITLTWPDGRMAVLMSSMLAQTDRIGALHGEDGFAIVENINNPERIRVFNRSYEQAAVYERPPQITGFEYELRAAAEAVRAGACECPQMPHAEILRIMELMDALRRDWGVKYPFE